MKRKHKFFLHSTDLFRLIPDEFRQYDIIAMDNDESTKEDFTVQQGQDIYAAEPVPEQTPAEYAEAVPQGDNLEQYVPPEPPPLSPGERVMTIFKRFGIPIILIIVAIGLVFIFLRFLRGGGSKKEITLNYWMLWEDEKAYLPLIDEYQKKNPTVKIVISKQTPKEYRERLENAILKGEGPDIFRFHNTWLPMFLQKNVIAHVPEKIMAAGEFEKTFYPTVKSDLGAKDTQGKTRYYGIPLGFDGLGLYYNETILNAAGVKVPTVWDTLRETAKNLTVKDRRTGAITTGGIALGTTNNIEFWSDIVGLLLYVNQADPYHPQSDNIKVAERAKDALVYYTLFALPPDNTWSKDQDNSILAFGSGRLALMFAPSWIAIDVKAINPDLAFKVAPVPQVQGSPSVYWGSYWVEGVSTKSLKQEEAFKFLAFLSNKESLAKIFSEQAKLRGFGIPYSRVDLAEQLKGHPILDAYIVAGPNARSGYLSARTFDNGINDQISKYYENAINKILDGGSPEGELGTISQGVGQVLSQFGLAK